MSYFTKIVAGTVLLAASATALAVPVKFNFPYAGERLGDKSLQFSAGGIELNVSAYRLEDYDNNLPFGTAKNISHRLFAGGNGLIVNQYNDSSHQIDGKNSNEIVVFDFSKSVEFKSINFDFAYGDGFEFFNPLSYNGDGLVGTRVGDGRNAIPGGYNIFNFGGSNISSGHGTSFGIGAFSKWDDFKIRNIVVHASKKVPEPATWGLMALGMGLLGFMRQAKSRQR